MTTRYKSQITYNEVNLQHSRAATDNLMQIMLTENRDFLYPGSIYIPKYTNGDYHRVQDEHTRRKEK